MTCAPDSRRSRPIGFFVHHQGRGHAKRCQSIIAHLPPGPVTVFCARPEYFELEREGLEFVRLPDFHGEESRTPALHQQAPCSVLDCAPLGVDALRKKMGVMAAWMAEKDPRLFVVDVSAEVVLLCRLCSVPAVKIRMHGDRSDPAHEAAYSASAAILAPFSEALEQPDYPSKFRRKTMYVGGLLDAVDPVMTREEARRILGYTEDQRIIVCISGGGGPGVPIAPITMAARAVPDALWILVGKQVRLGHETDFSNVISAGWVEEPTRYIAAADTVVSTMGDTLSHEVARVGRPWVGVPEWCYYDEQTYKAKALERLGALVHCPRWPASFQSWKDVLRRAQQVDVELQRTLTPPDAAKVAALQLDELARGLWQNPSSTQRINSNGKLSSDLEQPPVAAGMHA